ncbi:unnamed protein product [Prorocentrum cordatum]|uniref:Uncharacterized protein n=1 Tax=Prorocentrum cordatum TaxID=2364126 RepID=A0ABN9VNV1_9DINO|nr:unnamed protein product [Polarella glacialis]
MQGAGCRGQGDGVREEGPAVARRAAGLRGRRRAAGEGPGEHRARAGCRPGPVGQRPSAPPEPAPPSAAAFNLTMLPEPTDNLHIEAGPAFGFSGKEAEHSDKEATEALQARFAIEVHAKVKDIFGDTAGNLHAIRTEAEAERSRLKPKRRRHKPPPTEGHSLAHLLARTHVAHRASTPRAGTASAPKVQGVISATFALSVYLGVTQSSSMQKRASALETQVLTARTPSPVPKLNSTMLYLKTLCRFNTWLARAREASCCQTYEHVLRFQCIPAPSPGSRSPTLRPCFCGVLAR